MTVGIIANPVSGRDIRRVAARGGISSAEDKRNRIARAVIGAVAGGATHIVAMKEPFGIARALLRIYRLKPSWRFLTSERGLTLQTRPAPCSCTRGPRINVGSP